MLREPRFRVVEFWSEGGGATTDGSGAENVIGARDCNSGGGATTDVCSCNGSRRRERLVASGGGVTTELLRLGVMREISAAGASGTAGISSCGLCILSDQATMLGTRTSCFSLTFGGATIVCERLSASAGTEMMGCGARSGSAFAGFSAGVVRVSRGGRYSDGE